MKVIKRWTGPAIALACFGLALPTAAPLEAASLKPTKGSMSRQTRAATQHDYTYLRNRTQLRKFVERGLLVPVRPNADFDLEGVSFAYSRPEVRTFVHRLARQYRASCKEKLVVTSLTRPKSHQPRNASKRSVHPTGMALDLRRPRNRTCRSWLERTLVALEGAGVLEATRERWPPHYHVALFPRPYMSYLEKLKGRVVAKRDAPSSQGGIHRVQRGDTLWKIAQRYKTTVGALKRSNSLRSNRIYPGQRLTVPRP